MILGTLKINIIPKHPMRSCLDSCIMFSFGLAFVSKKKIRLSSVILFKKVLEALLELTVSALSCA